jgi:hypothetical protein
MEGSQSFILHQRARQHHWQGAGWLSIKSFVQGEALYKAEGGQIRLDDQRFLVLNDGQDYSIDIDAEQPVESFCVFLLQSWCATRWVVSLDTKANY